MNVLNALLIMAAVVFPFGWVIYRLIRYTAKSMGNESPLVVRVTYQVSKGEYFSRFAFLSLLVLIFFNLLLLYCMFFIAERFATAYWHWGIVWSGVAVAFYSLWFIALLFKLEWQYWLITKARTITLDPADKSLEIAAADGLVRITASDVEAVEIHAPGPESSKMVGGYHYFCFILKDGRRIYLNHNKSYLDYSITDYFKTVPTRCVPHKIPWIIAP
ncbi:hypothetical protein ACFQ4C_22375 [Larkinella insperata]|uniref:PH domain-containing protein n=1 Tax=Larkinella insperata TaxID=332158 RepID=A0ABW3Q889_9BACT|nr:hypothetical protein [Larkinella insperata]